MTGYDLLAVQGTLKSLLQHSSKAPILQRSTFFIVQLSHPYKTTRKTIALIRQMWSTGEGNCKPLQYACLQNPMNNMKRQKDRTLEDELPGLVDAQDTTGEE